MIAYARDLRRDLAALRARPSVPEVKAFLGEGRLIHHLLETDAQRVFEAELKLFEERLERRELHLLKLKSFAPQGVLDAAATQRLQELENSLTLTPEEYTVNRAAVLKPVAKPVASAPIASKPKPLPVKPPVVPVTKPTPAPAATPGQVKPTGAKGFAMQMGTCDRIYMDQKLGSLRDALLGGRAADATLVTNEVRRRCGARTEQLAYFNAKAVEILAVREEPPAVMKTLAIKPYVTRKFALVVGIGKFKYRVNPLQFAAKDALDFAQVLRDPAIGRYIDSDTYVRVLTDEQATVENIRRAMDYLEKATEPSDLVTVFVSTHGTNPAMDSGDEDGRLGYIVAHDTDPTALSATAIPMRQVKEWLDSRLRAQRVALFMDTCYSGGIGQAKVGGKSLAPAFISGDSLRAVTRGGKALVVDEAPEPSARLGAPMDHGRTLIVSSLSSEQSWESATLGPPDHPGNSYFTYYLIDGLRKLTRPGHTPDVRELFSHLERYVGDDVRREKQASQTPQMYNPKGLRVGEPLN